MFFVQVQSSSPPWRGAQRAGWLQCKSNFQLNFPHLRYTSLSVGTQSAGIVQLTCSLTKSPIKFPSVEGCPTCGVVTMQKHLPNPFEPARNSQLPTPNSQLPTPNSQLPTPNSQPFFISKSSKTSRCSFYSDKHTIHTLVHFHW
jgi:hypothetical protein